MSKPHTECNECEKVRECYLGVCVDCNGTDGQGAVIEWYEAKEEYYRKEQESKVEEVSQ